MVLQSAQQFPSQKGGEGGEQGGAAPKSLRGGVEIVHLYWHLRCQYGLKAGTHAHIFRPANDDVGSYTRAKKGSGITLFTIMFHILLHADDDFISTHHCIETFKVS